MICSGRDKIETPEQVSYYLSLNTFLLLTIDETDAAYDLIPVLLLLTTDRNRHILRSDSTLAAY